MSDAAQDPVLIAAATATGHPGAVAPLSANAKIEDERNSIAVFKAAAAATVFVKQKQVVVDPWSMRSAEVPAGSGTGFVWDKKGHIVTNFHVVLSQSRGRTTYEVSMLGGETLEAKLIGFDPNNDIAILKINAQADKLKPIRLPADASLLEVGQKTLAIGNPFGLDHTLTTGVISALGRSVQGISGAEIHGMIQTDASINPGNSGGPLLNSSGQLIGMNTMIFSKSGSSAGIGFAVPVKTIKQIVPQLIAYGAPVHVGVGITPFKNKRVLRHYGINGVVIESVEARSPAAVAGLRGLRRTRRGTFLGDVIIGIDGNPVRDYEEFAKLLERYKAGQEVKLTILRDKDRIQISVKLSAIRRRHL